MCAALLSGCGDPVQPIQPAEQRVLIHAVMDLGSNDQVILIERTPTFPPFSRVRNALVTVQIGQAVIPAFEDSAASVNSTAQVYRMSGVRSLSGFTGGATLSLRVIIPGGDTITGSTTMPSAFAAGAPTFTPDFDRDTDTLRLSWPRVVGAKGYQVSVYGSFSTDPDRFLTSYTVFTDTSVVIPGTARSTESGDHAFPPGRRVTVIVAAVDENYHLYYRLKVDPFAGVPPSKLTGGALGLFGSVVPILVRRYDVQ